MSSENKPVAHVEETCAGPRLLVYGVQAQSWLGTFYNQDAHRLAAEINAAAHPAPSERGAWPDLRAGVYALRCEADAAAYAQTPSDESKLHDSYRKRLDELLVAHPAPSEASEAMVQAVDLASLLPEDETPDMHRAVMPIWHRGVTRMQTNDLWRAYRAALLAAMAEGAKVAPSVSEVPVHAMTLSLLESERELERLRDALKAIGDYAHDHSTGPAVPDALWEVRAMAYDAMAEGAR